MLISAAATPLTQSQRNAPVTSCIRCHSAEKKLELLVCLHPICAECSNISIVTRDQTLVVVCPRCYMVTKQSDLIGNLWATPVTNLTANNKTILCSSCEEKPKATKFCVSCGDNLCDQCAAAHSRVRLTRNHSVKLLTEASTRDPITTPTTNQSFNCSTHRQEELQIFCENCRQLTCRDCQLTHHKGHKHSLLKEMSPTLRAQLEEGMAMNQTTISNLDKSLMIAKQRLAEVEARDNQLRLLLHNTIEQLSMAIINRGKVLLEQMKLATRQKQDYYQSTINRIENLKDLYKQGHSFAQLVLETPGSGAALMIAKQRLTKQLQEITSANRSDFLNALQEPVKIDLILEHKDTLTAALEKFGRIWCDKTTCSSLASVSSDIVNNVHKMDALPSPILVPPALQRFPILSVATRPISSVTHIGPHITSIYGSSSSKPTIPLFTPAVSTVPILSSASRQTPKRTLPLFGYHSANDAVPMVTTISVIPPSFVNKASQSTGMSSDPATQMTKPDSGQPVSLQMNGSATFSTDRCVGNDQVDVGQTSTKNVSRKQDDPLNEVGSQFKTVNVEDDESEEISSSTRPMNASSRIVMKIVKKPTVLNPVRFKSHGKWMKPNDSEPDRSPSWWDDYCAVCQNGCKDDEQLVCCGLCPRVFHGKCHIPVFTDVPEGDWNCGLCDPLPKIELSNVGDSHMSHYEKSVCMRVLLELYCQDDSAIFHDPVEQSVKDYYESIRNPMDFSTIRRRLIENQYISVPEFLRDLNLIFGNCAAFNGLLSDYGRVGTSVGNRYKTLIDRYLPDYASLVDVRPVELAFIDGISQQMPQKRRCTKQQRKIKRSRVARISSASSSESEG